MKQKLNENPSKVVQHENDCWIDVHNDEQLVSLGIRPANLIPKDLKMWTKTSSERAILKSLRHSNKRRMHFNSIPPKFIPVRGKLVIYLKKNNTYPNTTYSTTCWQHEISSILSKYYQMDNTNKFEIPLVSKYSYNGKTYLANERPFWPGK